jgi:hypothetical protein
MEKYSRSDKAIAKSYAFDHFNFVYIHSTKYKGMQSIVLFTAKNGAKKSKPKGINPNGA